MSNDFLNFLSDLSKRIDKIAAMDGEVIFKDSQRIGSQAPPNSNLIKGSEPAKDSRQAEVQAAYRSARLGKPYSPATDIPLDELQDEVVGKFVEEVIKRDLIGES